MATWSRRPRCTVSIIMANKHCHLRLANTARFKGRGRVQDERVFRHPGTQTEGESYSTYGQSFT